MTDFPNLAAAKYLCVDTETTGLDWKKDRVFGVSVCTPEMDTWYFDVRNADERAFVCDLLAGAREVVNHHIKFDLHMLRESGLPLDPSKARCTMIAAALINEHEMSYSLDSLATKYAGVSKDDSIWQELASIFGGPADRKTQIVNLPRAPRHLVAKYANQDTRAAMALWHTLRPMLEEQDLVRVFDIETRLMAALVRMEKHGVAVDLERTRRAADMLRKRKVEAEARLRAEVGGVVNFNSSQQLAKILIAGRLEDGSYRAVDGTRVSATEGGAPSIGAETLRNMAHPVAKLITELRGLDKTISTFLEGHILSHAVNGRVHPNYNQTKSDNERGTRTGRISVNDPALQQIHKRDKGIAQHVRSCFIPDHGQRWCSIDWSQIDFRVFAHYVNSPSIIAAYDQDPDVDYHSLVAKMANIPRDRSPTTGGGNAKQINLAMVFGMSAGRLAKEMGLSYTEEEWTERGSGAKRIALKPGPEAEEFFNKYHEAVPGVRGLLSQASALARGRGYVRTILGRRIRFPNSQFHKAAGLVFQGGAADALKCKIVEMDAALEGTGSHLLLNVHDEFDISVPPDDDAVVASMKNLVERFDGEQTPIKFRVPIRASVGIGTDWWEASK